MLLGGDGDGGPLSARIHATARHVLWFDFHQAHRAWVYPLGPFRVDRAGLEAALVVDP